MAEEPRQQWLGGNRAPQDFPIAQHIRKIFRCALVALNEARVPYVVGGAFALHWYCGFWRVVKDIDIYLLPDNTDWAMKVLEKVGFNTRVKHEQWLAEALMNHERVDLIFGMGNWLSYVDKDYIDRARQGIILGIPTRIVPVEELVYSKAFVASRERYDAADVFHLLVATASELDWTHLLDLFSDDWEVLLSHLVMFCYVYPSHRELIPPWVLDDLLARFHRMRIQPWTGEKLCRGFLLDGIGTYSLDVKEWGYRDARQEMWEKKEIQRAGARRKAA